MQEFRYLILYTLFFHFRNFVSDIHGKTGQILNKGSAQQIGGSAGGGYDNTIALRVCRIRCFIEEGEGPSKIRMGGFLNGYCTKHSFVYCRR